MTMKIQSFTQNMLRLATPTGVSLAFPSFLEASITLNSGIENLRDMPVSSFERQQRFQFMETYFSLVIDITGDGSGLNDVLGEFYGKYVRNDYVMTPQHIYDMLPGLFSADTVNMRIADYHCRSGRKLLAAARFNRALRLYGADPDITMVRMALLNLCLNGLTGEIAWYDARNDIFHATWSVGPDYRGKPVIRELNAINSLIFQKRTHEKPDMSRLIFAY
ncbi:MAG TPA: hypothetical protein PK892_13630 [Bacteroidales bacterium]|nr:hypothetical protein [Bacteroidales bacterium]